MIINPTLDRVLIKKCKFDEVFKSSLELVDAAKNNINKLIYEVVEIGPGDVINNNEIIMDVKPGDKVIVPEYIGSELYIDNIQYRIVKMSDILAVLEN